MEEKKHLEMAGPEDILKNPSYSCYFDKVQSTKKLPMSLQETLTDAFATISVSSFPQVPRGKGLMLSSFFLGILFLTIYIIYIHSLMD